MSWQKDDILDLADELGIDDGGSFSQLERLKKVAEQLGMDHYNGISNADTDELQRRLKEVKKKKEQAKEKNSNKKGKVRKGIGTLWQNIKGAIRGNIKDIFILKVKLFLYSIIAIFVLIALIVEGDAENTSASAKTSISVTYSSNNTPNSGNSSGNTSNPTTSGTTLSSAEMYNSTGSLILATNDEIEKIKSDYFGKIAKTNSKYYNVLNSKFFGGKNNTVAKQIKRITTNYETSEITDVGLISDVPTVIAGAAVPETERTLFDHILRTEKYNFNNIIWRNFIGGKQTGKVPLVLDKNSELQYPAADEKASNNDELDLQFFVTKARPYLQSWYIPFDLMLGTQDAQNATNLNGQFAYNIITNAYHQLVLDRYKIENLDRTTNYLVYDKTTTNTTVTRECREYNTVDVIRKAGEECTKADYEDGLCKDANVRTKTCTTNDVRNRTCGCARVGDRVSCCDTDGDCDYGVLEKSEEGVTDTKTYCVDTVEQDIKEEKDIREAKVRSTKETDELTYSWVYTISAAKMLDKTISNEYSFEEYFKYTLDNYLNFIDKKGNYANMSVEQYRESEQEKSHADQISTEENEYRDEKKTINDNNANWYKSYVISNWEAVPKGSKYVNKSSESKVVKKETVVVKEGKEYIDSYVWSDTLKFEKNNSGIYNIQSVKDVTGDSLSYKDIVYYNELYNEKDINLIDIMNSDNKIFKQYTEGKGTTDNIGIDKNRLDVSYNVLEKDLKELAEQFPLSGLMYGNSLNLIEGINLASIVTAGSVNEGLVNLALSYKGNSLSTMKTLDDIGIFSNNHWCAMFVSFCMRKLEKETGVTIPIPNYTSCTTAWKKYHEKVGFFDVKEWLERRPNAQYYNTDPAHLTSLSQIQPGDIVLFDWNGDNDPGNRDHTAIVKEVKKDDAGNVISITTIDGNLGGGAAANSYTKSKVSVAEHVGFDKNSSDLGSIASFISISTVIAEFEKGNVW